MKHVFLVSLIIGLAILTRAQSEYEVSGNGTNKILKGLISRDMLEKDTSFRWFNDNRAAYTPGSEEVATLKMKARTQDLQFLVFGGTWNEASKYILPRFFSLVDAASLSKDQVILLGVDQTAGSIDHLSETLHITRIPTIIVLKKEKEVGRVTRFGKDEQWVQDIDAILREKF